MQDFIANNWQWIIGSIIGILGVILGVIKWLYNILVKEKFAQHFKLINEQSQNYNTKFDETHKKIDKVDARVLIVQEDTAEIKGSLNTLIHIMERK